jgi:heme exporter protein A
MVASTCIDSAHGTRGTVTALASLDIEGLSLWRGERMLFRDLAFQVNAGETLALEGPNGAGKTSLLRAIAGFLEPRTGTIALRMKDGGVREAPEHIGWLGHHDGAKSQMTAHEALSFYAHYYGGGSDIDGALASVGIRRVRDLPVQYLSAGQKRRLALARLLLTRRALWLLDEPLAALDVAGKALVAELIAAHCRDGGLVIAATHEPLGLDCRRLVLKAAA